MTPRTLAAPSPNFDTRRCAPDMVVLHYTGMKDGPSALARLRDPQAGVSAHYMIEENGTVMALVDEDKRAWHAGLACWAGETDINACSIGIEIVNGGHDFGLPPFPDAQIESLIALVADILARWRIPAARLVGHSDVAPERKQDPGEKFPWQRLAEANLGLWPSGTDCSPSAEQVPILSEAHRNLAAIGYCVSAPGADDPHSRSIIKAFQRHWRPSAVTGVLDTGTYRLIAMLASLAGEWRD